MDSSSRDYTEAAPLPTEGIFGGIADAINSGRRVLSGVFQLFSLEIRRAGHTLVWMVALAALAAMLIVTAWLGLMAALALWAFSLGWTWAGAVLVIALVNLAAAALATISCVTLSRNLLFPATRRQLESVPSPSDAA